MKKMFIILMISFFTFFPCFASNQVRITGGVCINTAGIPDLEMVYTELSTDNQFWGFGWEVIFHKLGIGGNYYTNFVRDESLEWTINWYSEMIFLSYHFLEADFILDPFLQAGLGSAGGVYPDGRKISPYDDEYETLALSIFPFASAGLVLHFNQFLIGTKLNYLPVMKPVPVTDIPGYHLSNTLLLLFIGVSF